MSAFVTITGGDQSPGWVGAALIAGLIASPVVVGLTWRLADRVLERRRAKRSTH